MKVEFYLGNDAILNLDLDVVPRIGERCVVQDKTYRVVDVFHNYDYDGRGGYKNHVEVELSI